MARLKTRNVGSFPIWPAMPTGVEEGDAVAIAATTYQNPIRFGRTGSFNYVIQLIVTAGLTGTFSLQGSNVPFPELATDDDWVALTPTVVGTALAYAGAAGNSLVMTSGATRWIRVKYLHSSGSATIRAYASVDDGR